MITAKKTLLAFLVALVLMTGSSSFASAATKPISPADAAAQKGCEQVKLSLSINDAFLKLSAAEQTKQRTQQAIASENLAMATALKSFKAAAKLDKKWKVTAANLDTVIHTDKAAAFTSAFTALVATCTLVSKTVTK